MTTVFLVPADANSPRFDILHTILGGAGGVNTYKSERAPVLIADVPDVGKLEAVLAELCPNKEWAYEPEVKSYAM